MIDAHSLTLGYFTLTLLIKVPLASGSRAEGGRSCRKKVLERNYEVLTVQQVWRAASKDPIRKTDTVPEQK